jgi:hypothetical protein
MLEQDRDRLRRLSEWTADPGIISVCLDVDPAARSEGWRVELRDGLRGIAEAHSGGDHDHKLAVRETVALVGDRFPEEVALSGRTQVGFVEVGRKPGEGEWEGLQLALGQSVVGLRSRPLLWPLVELLDRGARRAVVAVSAERVRVWSWQMGQLGSLDESEAVLTSPQWREQKGPQMSDPGRGQATSSSGHDQFDQRLEANRERFLHEAADRLAHEIDSTRWAEIVVFGEAPYLGEFLAGLGAAQVPVRPIEGPDVISEPDPKIEERVERALVELRAERDAECLARVKDAALAREGRGSLSVQETADALVEGRVDRLLFVPGDDYPTELLDDNVREAAGREAEQGDVLELMIQLALATSAELIPIAGPAAEELREHGGVGALLRY